MESVPMATHRVTEQDVGVTLTVATGDVLELELEEPSTSGYRWAVDGLDQAVLEPGEDRSTPHPGVGGGGLRTFNFVAKSPGQTRLRLKLRRKWEGDDSAIKRLEFDVSVTG
jgi:inhibitor of cysteine peptidase